MQSHHVKCVVADLLATTAALTVLSIPAADANPGSVLTSPPANAADALAQYRQVAEPAEKLNEQKLKAQEDLNAKQAELGKAGADLQAVNQRARIASADKVRPQIDVDQLTDESFVRGAQFAKLSALLSGMYLGDSKIVHAPTDGDVVKIAAMPNAICNARRFAT